MKKLITLISVTLLFLFTSIGAVNAYLIDNGDFETGTLAYWSVVTTSGFYSPWDVGAADSGTYLDTQPFGTYDAFTEFEGESNSSTSLYQEVTINADSTATLSTSHRIVYDPGFVPLVDPARIFDITIRSASGGLLTTLYTENIPAGNSDRIETDLGWVTNVFDLSAYSGQTVRIEYGAYIVEELAGFANLEVDNIQLNVSPVPEPNTITIVALSIIGMGAYARRRFKKNG